MRILTTAVISGLVILSCSNAAFAAETGKPVVPAGPVYVSVPADKLPGEAVKGGSATETRPPKARTKERIKRNKAQKTVKDTNAKGKTKTPLKADTKAKAAAKSPEKNKTKTDNISIQEVVAPGIRY